MDVGRKIRELREARHFTQHDLETRSGLFCAYISRVECGYVMPSLKTLERLAAAVEVPLYQLFFDGAKPTNLVNLATPEPADHNGWSQSRKEVRRLQRLGGLVPHLSDWHRRLLLYMALKMAAHE